MCVCGGGWRGEGVFPQGKLFFFFFDRKHGYFFHSMKTRTFFFDDLIFKVTVGLKLPNLSQKVLVCMLSHEPLHIYIIGAHHRMTDHLFSLKTLLFYQKCFIPNSAFRLL